MPTAVETFENIVLHKTTTELVPFLLSLDKKDILALRQPAQLLKKDLEEAREVTNERGQPAYQPRMSDEQREMLALAGLALFTRKEGLARSFELPSSLLTLRDKNPHNDALWQVLSHARPDWLGELLARTTRADIPQGPGYLGVRVLEREGFIAYDAPTFARLLGTHLAQYENEERSYTQREAEAFVLNELRANPVLLHRDVWLLFDYDTDSPYDNTYLGPYPDGITLDWKTLLTQLAASGDLGHDELLTRSLLALRRDFRRPLLGWFKDLFNDLKPTAAERLARQQELVELLAHPLAVVVNFALDQLKNVWEAPTFDLAPLLQYADGLMLRPDLKTGLKTLLAAFEKLVPRHPALAPALARLAIAALPHADAGVQDRAARLLASLLTAKAPLGSPIDLGEIYAAIIPYADLLAPDARARLALWLTQDGSSEEVAAPAASYAPLSQFVPELTPATAIAPVADWHELLFLTGQVLATEAPGAVDRWVDGLLRLRAHLPPDHATQLRPYLAQVMNWLGQDRTPAEVEAHLHTFSATGRPGTSDLLAALVVGLATNFAQPSVSRINLRPHPNIAPDPLLFLEQRRLVAAEIRLRPGATPLPLLSTATHAPHWVAPTSLVEKLLAYQAAGESPDAADLAVALTRCAWSNPAAADQARARLPDLHAADLRALLAWLLAPAGDALPLPAATPETCAAGLDDPQEELIRDYGETITLRTTLLAATPVPVPAPAPAHAAALSPPLPVQQKGGQPDEPLLAHELLVPIGLAEALPWLWATAARTRYPTAELPALAGLGDWPGLARPWQPGWTLAELAHIHARAWEPGSPTVIDVRLELRVPDAPAAQLAPPLLPYAAYAGLPQRTDLYSYTLRHSLPTVAALLPNNPEPLHWHVLRTCCRRADQGALARDAVQQALTELLGLGPRHLAGTTALLAASLVHSIPSVRALALETLLSAIEHGRLAPLDLGRALGRLLAAEFAPVPRLTDSLTQARALSPRTDDALCQLLEALLPELPAPPPRQTAKLLAAYTDLVARTHRPVPIALQARLREWSTSGALKKVVAPLLG
jgi:hypothetical protein